MLKRAHKGTFHRLSPKHLQRYVNEFAGRHNIRDRDTIDQMTAVVAGLVGRRLMYRDLIQPTGRSPVAGLAPVYQRRFAGKKHLERLDQVPAYQGSQGGEGMAGPAPTAERSSE